MCERKLKVIGSGGHRQKSPKKILIVATPWANPEVPSIQIGVLKKYLVDRDVPAMAGHWYLNVAIELGSDAYAAVIKRSVLAAEPIYSYLLFPEMRDSLLRDESLIKRAQFVEKSVLKSEENPKVRFRWDEDFFKEFEAIHQKLLDHYDWNAFALVGFTLNYGQTVSSLYMAREIKKRNPSCKIILGGAEASGELGASLVEHFPQVDYACNGEGEIPLYNLSKALLDGASESEIRQIRGIICREEDGTVRVNPPQQVESLDDLRTPEYDDYIDELKGRGLDPQAYISELPIEASRGCPFSCNFCGLNLQWENFRSRSAEKVSADIRELSQKYSVLNFRFMDNILPRNSEQIFKKIAEQGANYRFFYEIRAQTSPKVLRLMRSAGAGLIQFGLEALSTSVLKKFNKKSKFINNLQAMKLCEELGIETENNIITDFPLSTEEDVEETIRNMEYCLAYHPPYVSKYFLGVGSPDYERAKRESKVVLTNEDYYRRIYPPALFEKLNLMGKNCRKSRSKAKWNRVVKGMERWRRLYLKGKKKLLNARKPLLAYFDGETFLKIEDYRGRDDGAFTAYLLDGRERNIYLFADEIRPWNAFREHFSMMEEAEIKALLQYFLDHKLMYEEDGHYLSLAMNADLSRALQGRMEHHETVPEAGQPAAAV